MSENQFLYLSRADVEKTALDMPTILRLLLPWRFRPG